MSHFTCLVITASQPDAVALAAVLQPYHEFECTGTNDQYVVDVDQSAEALEEFASATETWLKAPDGTLHCRFDEKGEWKLEFSRLKVPTDRWDTGRREGFVPAGYEEVEVKVSDHCEAAKWIADYYGAPIAGVGEGSNYGEVEVDADGKFVKLIKRTNPNKHWDWWVIGGRWSGFLQLRDGSKADQARIGAVDIEGMRDAAAKKAGELWDKVAAATLDMEQPTTFEGMRELHDNIDAAREAYWAQPAIVAIKEAFPRSFGLETQLAALGQTREDCLTKARNGALSTFAAIVDGKWVERGQMGWFGMSFNEKPQDDWDEQLSAAIDAAGPDAWLTVVDCHI